MCQRTHIPSWPFGQVSGGGFLFSALGGLFNFRELLWRINHKDCWGKWPEPHILEIDLVQQLLDAPWQLPELLSHHALSEVGVEAKCVWFQ